MKLSRRALNFMLKNDSTSINSFTRGLLLKTYRYPDEVVAAGYLLDLVRSGKYSIDDVSRLFGGKTASLIITALPYTKSDNLSSYENDKQFLKTINYLPINNVALICADIITHLDSLDLSFIKNQSADFEGLGIDFEQASNYYNLIYETFNNLYSLGIIGRLKDSIDNVFNSSYIKEDVSQKEDKIVQVNSSEELNSLKTVVCNPKPSIIELCAKGNFDSKSLYNRLLSFFDSDSFKVKVKDESEVRGRFEEEVLADKTGISSFEKNVIILSSLNGGLLNSIIDNQNIIIVDEEIYDVLLHISMLLKKDVITLQDIKRYLHYYRYDINSLINYSAFHYNAVGEMKDDIFFDQSDYENIKRLIEGLSNEAKLNEGEATIVVAGTLLPIMQESKVLALKKIIHKD